MLFVWGVQRVRGSDTPIHVLIQNCSAREGDMRNWRGPRGAVISMIEFSSLVTTTLTLFSTPAYKHRYIKRGDQFPSTFPTWHSRCVLLRCCLKRDRGTIPGSDTFGAGSGEAMGGGGGGLEREYFTGVQERTCWMIPLFNVLRNLVMRLQWSEKGRIGELWYNIEESIIQEREACTVIHDSPTNAPILSRREKCWFQYVGPRSIGIFGHVSTRWWLYPWGSMRLYRDLRLKPLHHLTPAVEASRAGDYISKYLKNTSFHLETGPSQEDDHTYFGRWLQNSPATMRWQIWEGDV